MSGPQHVLNYRGAHDQGFAQQPQHHHQALPPMQQGSHHFAAPHAPGSGHGFGNGSASWGHASEYATSQGSGAASLPGNPSTDNMAAVSSYGSEFAAPSSAHNDLYGRQGLASYPQEPPPFSSTAFEPVADAPYPMHTGPAGSAAVHKFEPGLSFADPSTARASILNGAPPLSNAASHLGPVRTGSLNGAPRPKPPKKPPLGRTDISSAADPEHAKEVLRTLRARHPDSSEPAPSCDRCRRRKIRCDREKPTCGNCVQSGRECTTDDVLRKRGPPSKKERELMEAAGIVFHGARPKQKKGPKPPARSAPGSSSGVPTGARGGIAPSGFAAPAGSTQGPGAPARESWNDILANMTEPSRPLSHVSASSWQQQQHQPSRSLDLDGGQHGYPPAPSSWDNHGRSRPASPGHADSGRRLFPHGAVGARPAHTASSLRSASSVHTWDPSRPDDAYGGQSPSVDASSVDWAHARGASNASGAFPSNASVLSANARSSVPTPLLPVNGTATPPTWSRDEQRWQSHTSPDMAQSWNSGRNSLTNTSGPLYVVDAEGELRQRDPTLYYRSVSDIMRQWPDGPVPSVDPDPRVVAPGPSGVSVWANAQAETPRSRWQVDRLISHELATVLLDEYFAYQNHIHPFLYEPRVRTIFYALQELAVERLDGRVSGNSSARSWSPLQLRHRQALILGILAMTSCTSDGLPLQGGSAALAWEYGHGCFHLARDLLSPTASMGGWPSLGHDALGGQENAQLERIQGLAIMGIYLANEASRENTREVLRMGWDLGRSIDAHRSRSFAASDPRRCDDVDREMLKRSMWACFMMLQMVRLAAAEQRKGVYPAAEEVSQLDVPIHLHPSIENEPALEAWVSELRVDVILASVLDSPLAAPPMTTGKAFENEQQVHDTHLRESWARELLSQLDNWAASAVCYDTRPFAPSLPRSFNTKKSRANHQICRSLIRNGLANVGSLFNVGDDPRIDGTNQHEPDDPQDRVSAWISTTPSVAIRALCGDKRTGSPWEQGSA